MSTLDDFPVDLKFFFLKEITDLDSLFSLILASRNFLSVYRQYKNAIYDRVLENEILQHKRDAFFITVFLEKLLFHPYSEIEREEIWMQYTTFDPKNPSHGFGLEHDTDYSWTIDIPWDIAKTYHMYIRAACRLFVKFAALFNTWGFWDFMDVRVMRDFYWKFLAPFTDEWYGEELMLSSQQQEEAVRALKRKMVP
ncbi:hypothetical protein ABW20_dc0107078 [Dactylellina cionopaga]|nr:hypothetical protein ABW20_dc0107078 [Dactylellina cionopaga]